jgi:hypothetical protein
MNNPTTIAGRLSLGNRMSVPNMSGAIMYSIAIAEVPITGMPVDPANGLVVE